MGDLLSLTVQNLASSFFAN